RTFVGSDSHENLQVCSQKITANSQPHGDSPAYQIRTQPAFAAFFAHPGGNNTHNAPARGRKVTVSLPDFKQLVGRGK
ncbi:hypothetical protein, partial [Pantoea sp.]|uniref:hypothetical protein n=1 Tax=Pantoea sp. TaxID=69393 RepID=UPI0028AFDDCB